MLWRLRLIARAGCIHLQVHTFELQEVDGGSRADAQSLMECVLHGIDIGHPSYPWEEECRWARLVGTEFQAQVSCACIHCPCP
jgi:hypothetical protein